MSYPNEYFVLSSWNSQGVPSQNLTVDNVHPDVINRIINVIPERSNIPIIKPTYVSNTVPRNLIIQYTDEKIEGVDVYVTFLYEGAGYLNTVGYYVYPLNPNTDERTESEIPLYKIPTKWNGNKWVPMTYVDRNNIDSNGKSILKKTIIFPNASLPSWANSNGKNTMAGGGNLLPGSKVKLAYDPTDPSKPFPNNTGIGFFLIPNGFSGGKVSNVAERIYSDNIFNTNNGVQTILLNDIQNTTDQNGNLIISFEDIMRPGGDSDFNDVIIKVSWTPLLACDTSNSLILPSSDPIRDDGLVIDRTGMYFCLTNNTVSDYYNRTSNSYTFTHTIVENDDYGDNWNYKEPQDYKNSNDDNDQENEPRKTKFDHLCNLFKVFDIENEGSVTIDSIDSKKCIKINTTIKRSDLQNYIYIINSFKNRGKSSPVHSETSALVELQNMYVKSQDKISQFIEIKNMNSELVKSTVKIDPKISDLTTPYALGDPHITTIFGDRFELPNNDGIYELYNDGELEINVKLNSFHMNKNRPEYNDLKFMEFLGIKLDNKSEHIISNMFHVDVYYVTDVGENNKRILSHNYFKLLKEEDIGLIAHSRRNIYRTKLGTNQFQLRYINFNTKNLGNVFVELMHIPHRCDTVNAVSLIPDNMMFASQSASGALIRRGDIIRKDYLV